MLWAGPGDDAAERLDLVDVAGAREPAVDRPDVALGGALMVVVQAPFLWRQLRLRGAAGAAGRAARPGEQAVRLETAVIWTVLLFALCRQSQVLIERFLASSLPAGAISHLNYAQKVAQMPMVLSLMLSIVGAATALCSGMGSFGAITS